MKTAILALAALLIAGVPAMAETKEPPFKLIRKEEPFEVREYAPMIVAEVIVDGEREKAVNDGFRILADYIFGNNVPKADIAMTAPVTQQPLKGEDIAMTAPVTQQGAGQGRWKVHFVMPENYTMDTIPKPVDPRVRLMAVPAYRTAVIRFSGFGTSSTLSEKTNLLRDWIEAQGEKEGEAPVFAFYNPPWTLPFFRRNEVMIRLAP